MRELQEYELLYDETLQEYKNVQELIDAGYTLVCPKCRKVLIIALDPEAAAKHKVHPGIYCPTKQLNHVCVLVELMTPERRAMMQKWRELAAKERLLKDEPKSKEQ